jgi:hypothetical protein
MSDDGAERDDGTAGAALLPPPPVPSTGRTPVAGESTPMWRLTLIVAWVAVAVAMGSVWKTSDQLGLSTWWIGPRGEQQPRPVQLLPFLPSLVMVVAVINNARRLPLLGAIASVLTIAVGVADLWYLAKLGVVEIAIGVAAGAISLASSAGVFRPARAAGDPTEAGSAVPDAAPSPLG